MIDVGGVFRGDNILTKRIAITKPNSDFNPHAFLSTIGKGRQMLTFGKGSTVYGQGDPSDGLFFIQKGKIQLSVVI
jgi:CRP-like cAMP-binding protein